MHSLKRRDAERLTHAGHNEHVRVLVAFIHLLAALEAREVTPVGYSVGGCQLNHGVQHVAAAGKAEADVVGAVEHALGCFDEVFRSLLHGDTSQIGHHLLSLVLARLYGADIL